MGVTFTTALAAPVEDGMTHISFTPILATPRRTIDCTLVAVMAWTVDMTRNDEIFALVHASDPMGHRQGSTWSRARNSMATDMVVLGAGHAI